MARYLFSSIRILTARNNNKYVRAKLRNLDYAEKEFDYIFFQLSSEWIKNIEPYLSTKNGGTADKDLPIPNYLRTFNGKWINYHIGDRFFKKHKGSFVRKADGTVEVFTSLKIFCLYYYDNELGQEQYFKNGFPETIAKQIRRIKKRYIVPYSETLERELNKELTNDYSIEPYVEDDEYDTSSLYYDDGLDMDQQSEDFYKELGIF